MGSLRLSDHVMLALLITKLVDALKTVKDKLYLDA